MQCLFTWFKVVNYVILIEVSILTFNTAKSRSTLHMDIINHKHYFLSRLSLIPFSQYLLCLLRKKEPLARKYLPVREIISCRNSAKFFLIYYNGSISRRWCRDKTRGATNSPRLVVSIFKNSGDFVYLGISSRLRLYSGIFIIEVRIS